MAVNEPLSLLEPVDLPLRDDDLFYIVQSGVTSTSTASRQLTFLDFLGEISTSVTGIEIQVEGVPITDQTLLNLTAGNNVTITNPSGGLVVIESSGGGGGGGMAIGGAVTSGTAGRALFVDTGPVLAQEKDLGASPAASDTTAAFASPTDDTHVVRLGFLSGASLKGYIESARQASTNDGYLAFITRAGAATWTQAMLIDATQNVGIGTSPTPRLHVASQDDTTSQIRVDRLTSNVFSALGSAASGTLGYVGTLSNHPFHLRTNNTSALNINTSQQVGIGVTAATYQLQVKSSAGNTLGIEGEIGASPSAFDVQMYIGETTDGRIARLGFHSGGSVKAIIEAKQVSSTNDGYLAFQTRSGAGSMAEIMRLTTAVNIPGLTATRAVYTDGSKNLVSAPAGATFGPSAVASITVVNGLVTAIS